MTSPNPYSIPVRNFLACFLLLLSFSVMASATQQSSLAVIPSSNNFGTVQVGSSKTAAETLTNSGSGKVTVAQVTITGAGFSFSGLDLPLALTPGQSYTFKVQFAPKTSGSVTGNISVVYGRGNSSNTVSIAVSGTGSTAGQLAVSPSALSFGNVIVGSSKSMSASLSTSGASVTVSSATLNNSEFSLSGVTFPFTIAAGKSASFTVKFAPQASGSTSASLSFKSNATTSTTVESLSGSGAVSTHSVALTWSPVSSISGYHIYRGTQSGGPYSRINSVLDVSTSFTDTAVQAGYTYYYVTTAVNASGVQSAYSNQVKAVIPNP
jgi:Abnormal spindle-like microcephaly-assoc'd, ASPM-SPD-2-Hydin